MGNRQEATKFFNQAVTAHNDANNPNRLQLAYQLFASACITDPTWPEAWYQSGNNNSELNLWYSAIACWRRGLLLPGEAPTDRAKMMSNMGWRLFTIGRIQEALEVTQEALAIDPTLANVHINLSQLHQILGNIEPMVKHGAEAYRLTPDDPTAEVCYAFALLFARQFEQGFERFEARFPYKLRDYLQYPYAKWEGEPDQTVYVVADQGLGDTLSYARFLEAACARSKFVHVRIQSELYRLFQHAFAHIKNLHLIPGLGSGAVGFPPADAWTTFVSLPYAMKLTSEQVRNAPNIAFPRWQMPVEWRSPDAKLHVGIAWRGSPLNDIDRHRNLPLHLFFELYRVPGIQLYSLQVGEFGKEMHDIGGAPLIADMTPYIRDVCDTMAVLDSLDLVITCESALGHICTAVGKECWVPYSYLGRDYRIGLDGTDQIWSRHRIFRQGADLKWEPVFAEIVELLKERVKRY